MRRGIPIAILAVLVAGCGKASRSTAPSSKTPLAVAASRRSCPRSDANPQLRTGRSGPGVLVSGHPTKAMLCRYWGGYSPRHPEDGHPARSLAEALRIVRPDVVGRLAGELNGLPSIDPRANCDELLGGRSELIIFQSPDRKQTKVLIVTAACIPVTNGRIVRAALGAGYRAGEIHWIDEALLLDLPRTP